jgi:long-subunit fatty acid transport protein
MKTILGIILLTLTVLLTPDIPCAYTIGQSVGVASSPNPVGSGARAVGMGGAFIAIADDATAASWNPAGLTQLETPEISVVGAQVFRSEDFSSSSNPEINNSFHTNEPSLNYFSASYPFNFLKKNMVVSLNYQRLYEFKRSLNYNLAMSVPPPVSLTITQSRNYEQDGYLSALGLAYAIDITPAISLGLTLNMWTGQFGWRNGWEENYTNHSVTTLGLTKNIEDSHITEKYSNLNGVNMNFGLLWNANKYLTIGAVLKTPFSANFDHQYTDDWIQRDGNGNVKNSSYVSISDEIQLRMPLSYGIGFAWRFSDQFTIDLDVYRTHWSEYILTDGQGNEMSPINALPKSVSDINDTTQIRIGGEYIFINPGRNWVASLRGGMFYDPEPSQGKVKDFYGLSIGSGISYQRYVFDLAYQLRWGRNVDTRNLIAASEANIMQHLILFSFILHF